MQVLEDDLLDPNETSKKLIDFEDPNVTIFVLPV